MFAMKAHHSLYRIGSRLSQNSLYATIRNALVQMAQDQRDAWVRERQPGIQKKYTIVLDNIQAYAKRRNVRIGRCNQMLTGTGATAVEMEDCPEGAFELQPIMDARNAGKRREATAEVIAKSIDVEHTQHVGSLHWLDSLVTFVPALASYQPAIANLFRETAGKHQINPKRHTTIHPLGTNSENEMTSWGLKRAMEDFIQQIGLTPEAFESDKHLLFMMGDGKTFEGMNKVKHYLEDEDGDFAALRFVQPNLEIWHTKWTDLGRICRGAWGKGFKHVDPSTLGYMAKAMNSPAPNDFLKVDFYTNFNLVQTVMRAHMLSCWE